MTFTQQLLRLLGRPEPAPPPPDIRIAGIYTICQKLRLAKSYRPEYLGRQMLVPMTSGRDAVYEYADFKIAPSVDWDWHIYRFVRYAIPDKDAALPRYN